MSQDRKSKLKGLYRKYETDKSAEEEGVWIPIDDKGSQIRVSRLPNKGYTKRMRELQRPYKKLLAAGGSIPDDKQKDITSEALAYEVLRDWKGEMFEDEDGKPVRYSPALGKEVLLDMEDFADTVTFVSADVENFRLATIEETAKNSKATSRGTSTGKKKSSSS